ncbi:MAG: ABC transporter substrate-binding protein [Alphaproteobacteria bacterium]|nr:ABC transporter substrate-binding protein [Alphaproteobacteria bacterium]
MTGNVPGFPQVLSRRALLGGLATVVLSGAAVAAADHPALAYMRKVAKDMLNAHRQGTVNGFKSAIQRHADVHEIADYSLGQYRKKLPSGQRERYYSGVVNFMARYFADQSREYPIAKYEIGEARVDKDKDVLVNSKVFLLSGQTYTVVWRLGWRGGRYKVLDVKVLGFSMVYMQRGLFTSFITKRNGDVGQLVAALNK